MSPAKPDGKPIFAVLQNLLPDQAEDDRLVFLLSRCGADSNFDYLFNLVFQIREALLCYLALAPQDVNAAQLENLFRTAVDELKEDHLLFEMSARTGIKNQYPLSLPLAREIPDRLKVLRIFKAMLFLDITAEFPKMGRGAHEDIATQLQQASSDNQINQRQDIVESMTPILDSALQKGGDKSRPYFIKECLKNIEKNLLSAPKQGGVKLMCTSLKKLLEESLSIPQKESKPPERATNEDRLSDGEHGAGARAISIDQYDDEDSSERAVRQPFKGRLVVESSEYDSKDHNHDILDRIWSVSVNDKKRNTGSSASGTSNVVSIVEGGDDLPLVQESGLATTRRTSRWVDKTIYQSPTCTARWNKIERDRFLLNLRRLALSGEFDSKLKALFIYLMYLTGTTLNQIKTWRYGLDEVISPKGTCLRTLDQPADSYAPDRNSLSHFEPTSKELLLSLPAEVVSLLDSLPLHEGSSLASLIAQSFDTKKELISELTRWRENGRYRLGYRRLTAALHTELMVITNDPLITHLLSGSAIHASHVMQYYCAVSHENLCAEWNRAQVALLSLA